MIKLFITSRHAKAFCDCLFFTTIEGYPQRRVHVYQSSCRNAVSLVNGRFPAYPVVKSSLLVQYSSEESNYGSLVISNVEVCTLYGIKSCWVNVTVSACSSLGFSLVLNLLPLLADYCREYCEIYNTFTKSF